MKIVQRYLAREILVATAFVLLAFIALSSFFDFVSELGDIGKNGYKLENSLIIVLLQVPGHIYELLPIVSLIGSIYALSRLATHSEFTILRVAGMSTGMAVRFLLFPGLLLVGITFIVGELVTPWAEQQNQEMRIKLANQAVAKEFHTGLWVKDTTRIDNQPPLIRFVNIGDIRADKSLNNMRIYEFDARLVLHSIRYAARAEYLGTNGWRLYDVTETLFEGGALAVPTQSTEARTRVLWHESMPWQSELTPQLLTVLLVAPERMGANNLGAYIRHLDENRQTSNRYQIAFWKKLFYPFATLVMMAVALPFAYLHVRSGGTSFKIFAGIMIGIGFYLINSLFSHLGLLNTWSPVLTAVLPSILMLGIAMIALRWVDHH